MLSEKQFRERAKSELRQIGDQVLGLATDRDIYWRLEREIIQPNPQLRNARSDFLDMLRGGYTDAMAARAASPAGWRRQRLSRCRVCWRSWRTIRSCCTTGSRSSEFADDRAALEQAATNLQASHRVRTLRHHERTLSALASTHRELDARHRPDDLAR